MIKQATQYIAISKLEKSEYNPRQITPKQFESLKKSLAADPAFFDMRPCLVNRRTDKKLVIYAGNMRYDAAKALSWSAVPCVVVEIPIELEKERALKDNNAYGEYQEDQLGKIFHELYEAGKDVMSMGFTPKQAKLLLEEGMLTKPFPGDFQKALGTGQEAVSKPGEIYELGRHRLLCGDATDPSAVLRLLGEGKVTLCLTDPPYSVDYASRKAEVDDCMRSYYDPENADALLTGFIKQLPCEALVMTYGDKHLFAAVNALQSEGWKLVDMCVWVKQEPTFWPGARYQQQHELIWMCVKGKSVLPCHTSAKMTTLFAFNRKKANEDHPTQKPLALWSQLLANHFQVGDIIYDPFGGSGTTLITCEQMNRKCLMVELSPHFCDVIRNRYAALKAQNNE